MNALLYLVSWFQAKESKILQRAPAQPGLKSATQSYLNKPSVPKEATPVREDDSPPGYKIRWHH